MGMMHSLGLHLRATVGREGTRGHRSRRMAAAVGLVALWLPISVAMAQTPSHGLSTFGDLKYPAGFKHFDYVNPDAPKGGRLAMIGPAGRTTFDSFNAFILRGDAAQGLELLFDALMVRAADEPSGVYGLVASEAALAADKRSVTFKMRPEARFADGTPVTAADATFSFETLKAKGHPSIRMQLRDVTRAEALDQHTVRYMFEGELVRDLPIVVAGLPLLSKAYYTSREFDSTSLEPPLGSGPYRIAEHRQGAFVTYKRREDYWARDLNVAKGRFNFDEVRYEYYRDRTAELEGLKAGNYDLREEFTSRDWATGYDIPAVKEGRLVRETLPDASPSGAQGFFLNTRRVKFQDIRVRRALDLAFDYEWTNKNLFFSLYTRTTSYFENSDMKATGRPSAEELALLEPFRARLPAEVFGEPYLPPVSDGSGSDRKLLREAARLMDEAGWKVKDGKRANDKGEVLDIEFLVNDPTSERLIGPYVKNLQAIGIQATIRRVDPAQYERRSKSFDYDVKVQRFVMRLTPGVELKNYWGSEAAGAEGSFNLSGIKDPVIDALIEKVMAARSRAEMVTATRAIDRVLRAGHYWVPHWYKASHHMVYWSRFSRPAIKPLYDRGVDTWWFDIEKAAKLKAN
jgi:microcin C transport system substrate-binding protein